MPLLSFTRSRRRCCPSTLGAAAGRAAIADKFVAWTRGYREGVALAHGYGHPRLQKSGPSPVPGYVVAAGRARGGGAREGRPLVRARSARRGARCSTPRSRRPASAGLPPRPIGQHVVADLMAFYFRSSEANDDCYNALINREVCRPIAITTRKPEPLRRRPRDAETAEHAFCAFASSAWSSR